MRAASERPAGLPSTCRPMGPSLALVVAAASHMATRLPNPYDSDGAHTSQPVLSLPPARIFESMVTGSEDTVEELLDKDSVAALSVFLIARTLENLVGKKYDAKKLSSGDLLVEVTQKEHSDTLLKQKQFAHLNPPTKQPPAAPTFKVPEVSFSQTSGTTPTNERDPVPLDTPPSASASPPEAMEVTPGSPASLTLTASPKVRRSSLDRLKGKKHPPVQPPHKGGEV
ncbi:hypothetical protein HPB52_016349 [Rhipicephalus sanguineus]|uniref:Uncharacterized protein n=1 Tax=Rhipicephalus sanguineus TaxID=34632 RepID=A0A9D4PY06_RHISA|nr:hypothetical protein HPB52_016349 [Rhipicephalus sanguineus]